MKVNMAHIQLSETYATLKKLPKWLLNTFALNTKRQIDCIKLMTYFEIFCHKCMLMLIKNTYNF